MAGVLPVVAYVRRSTNKQALSRAAQLRVIRAEAERRGWEIIAVESDTRSGRSRRGRVGLAAAAARCSLVPGSLLVAARLDRLCRSVVDLGLLIEEAQRRGFGIAVLDVEINTGTANGRLVANVLAAVGQWEAEIIGERTRDALAVKRDRGWRPAGRMTPEAEAAVLAEVARVGSVAGAARALGMHRTAVRRVVARAA